MSSQRTQETQTEWPGDEQDWFGRAVPESVKKYVESIPTELRNRIADQITDLIKVFDELPAYVRPDGEEPLDYTTGNAGNLLLYAAIFGDLCLIDDPVNEWEDVMETALEAENAIELLDALPKLLKEQG